MASTAVSVSVRFSILCAVICLFSGIAAAAGGVSAEVKSVSFDFVMRELIKQRVDIEKQAAEMDRQREEIAKQKAELERQSAEFQKQARNLEKQNVKIDEQRAKLERQAADSDKHKLELQKLRDELQVRGTSYIRWGRTTCGRQSSTLYRGHVAGGHSISKAGGGGSNYLCLHDTPQWSRVIDGFSDFSGGIYGAEFGYYPNTYVFSNQNNGGRTLHLMPASCAGCYSPNRTTVMMFPARTECPPNWIKEYQGYIVSDLTHHTYSYHRRSSYVCFDEAPETATGPASQHQGLLYPVQVGCGSLPCSRFINGWELACVVCTK